MQTCMWVTLEEWEATSRMRQAFAPRGSDSLCFPDVDQMPLLPFGFVYLAAYVEGQICAFDNAG